MRSRALGAFHRSYAALRRLLAVLTAPVRRTPAYESHVIQPYRGYGTTDHVHLRGRVFRQPRLWAGPAPGSLPRQLIDLLRRILRWGSGNVAVTARANGAETRTRTDPDGYFRIDLDLTDDPVPAGAWCDVQLEAQFDDERVQATGQAYVPPTSSRFVVISDIDDTVMHTGVASKARMMWNLFMADADSRVAFPGVGAFYRALHAGADGGQGNPMLYVSRAPWSIYEVARALLPGPRDPRWAHPVPPGVGPHAPEHSSAMARHAAERELIAAEAADEVARQERRDTTTDGA